MNKQHRQYVILIVVLLSCAASVFFGVKSILHSNDEVTTFAVGDWEGITLPRYHGPAVYSTPAQQGYIVTLPMASPSSRSMFHHNAAATYHAGVTTTRQPQTSYTAYKVHQTSDQVSHSIGSGNGSSGSASMGTTNYSSSSSAAYSMPSVALTLPSVHTRTLANNNINVSVHPSLLADATEASSVRVGNIRRLTPDGEGEYPGEPNGDPTNPKIWDEVNGWVDPPAEGTICTIGGVECVWTGNGWRPTSELPEPGTPIGDIPWLMFVVAAAVYGLIRVRKSNKVTEEE